MTLTRFRTGALAIATILSVAACGQGGHGTDPVLNVDTLIINGSVFSGTAHAGTKPADVAVRGDRVVFVGEPGARAISAVRTIDATGLIVAPGFIDPHTHSLDELLSATANANLNYLKQGVTTVFNGNDGDGPVDFDGLVGRLEQNGIGTNTALYIGHGSLRTEVMNGENRPPTETELARMSGLVAAAMQSGALGLSTGLYYAPGNFATTGEVVALASVAARYGGIYDSHIRDESSYNIGLLGAIDEALTIGRDAAIPVHIAHIKALGVDVWGQSAAVIERIETARSQGQSVTADQYPWRASGTHLRNTLLPRALLSGAADEYRQRLTDPAIVEQSLPAMTENLRRRGGPESLLVVMADDPSIVGMTLAEIAESRRKAPIETAIELILAGSIRVASFNMNQQDIDAFMARDWVMTSSDGTDGHPRKYASFPEKYREYVVGRGVLSLEEFVYRSSGLAAEVFGLDDRGRIAEGFAADIVVFDPAAFAPEASFANWNALASGVRYLFVNGQLALDEGRYTGALPGRVLLKRAEEDGERS